MSTALADDPTYSQAYYLLDEIVSTSAAVLSPTVLGLLAEASLELTDYGADAPTQALLPLDLEHPATAPAEALLELDQLLARLLLDSAGLPLTLRVSRARDLVTQARRVA